MKDRRERAQALSFFRLKFPIYPFLYKVRNGIYSACPLGRHELKRITAEKYRGMV